MMPTRGTVSEHSLPLHDELRVRICCRVGVSVHMATLFTPRKTHENLAVTGALSLTGRVLPVANLQCQLEAAYHKGITNIALPVDNAPLPEVASGKAASLVDVESHSHDMPRSLANAVAAAHGTSVRRGEWSLETEVPLARQLCDTMKFFAISSAFDCLLLALDLDNNNCKPKAAHPAASLEAPLHPPDLRSPPLPACLQRTR